MDITVNIIAKVIPTVGSAIKVPYIQLMVLMANIMILIPAKNMSIVKINLNIFEKQSINHHPFFHFFFFLRISL